MEQLIKVTPVDATGQPAAADTGRYVVELVYWSQAGCGWRRFKGGARVLDAQTKDRVVAQQLQRGHALWRERPVCAAHELEEIKLTKRTIIKCRRCGAEVEG